MEEPLLPSNPANPAQAADLDHDDNGFVNVEEEYGTISLNYHPDGKTNSMTYEAVLKYLAESTKLRLELISVSTSNHMEHSEKILRTCNHFEYVSFLNYSPSPMNQHMYNWLKNKSIEKENNNIHVHFAKEFYDNKSQLYIDVKSNGLNIDFQIFDPECTVYPQFLDYLKEISNKNSFVRIRLDGTVFKDLFRDLNWQYESYMEENLSNGVATTIRVLNDNNIYALDYWEQVCRLLDEEDYRKSEEKERIQG